MAVEAPERIGVNHYKFYTQTPQEQFVNAPDTLPESLNNRYFASLVSKCLLPFEENSPTNDKKAVVKDRIQLFSDGEAPYSPMSGIPYEVDTPKGLRTKNSFDRKEAFVEQAKFAIARYCQDYFEADGSIASKHEQDWYNLVEIAPELVKIMTSRDNYVTLAHENHAVNIIASATHMARYPETQIVLRTGIGGSDDEFTSHRFAAYGLPALKIAEDIQSFYAQREDERLVHAAIDKAKDLSVDYLNTPSLSRGFRKDLSDQVRAIIKQDGLEALLSPEEQTQVCRKYAIAQDPISIQFFFADEAAIAINHTMDAEKIPARTAENTEALADHVNTFHPAVAEKVTYLKDIPWSSHKPYARTLIEYLAEELRQADDKTVRETLSTLETLGDNHGGENGSQRAAEYAAMHPLPFGDRLNLPFTSYLQGVSDNPTINITVGGRTERHFCAIREYLSTTANPTRLVAFIEAKIDQGIADEEVTQYTRMIQQINRWERRVGVIREKYVDEHDPNPKLARPDKPLHDIMLVTNVGYTPTYYATEYDRPWDSDAGQYYDYLQSEVEQLATKAKSADLAQENALKRSRLHGVMFDIAALREAREV